MNLVDIIIGILLLMAFYAGFKKGLLVSLASLIGMVLGVYGAIYFSDFVGGYLAHWFSVSPQTMKWISLAVTFLGILFILNFIGKLLTKVADLALLGFLNKLLGGVFSALKFAFILSVIFYFFSANNFTGYVISEEKKENSLLYEPIASIAPIVLPTIIQEFKTLTNTEETTETPEATENNVEE